MQNTIIAVVVASALSFGAGWKVHDWKVEAEASEGKEKAAKKEDKKAEDFEDYKQTERVKFMFVRKEVERIVEKPFYAASAPECLDADGLRALDDALRGKAPSEPASSVSADAGSR